MNSFIIGTAGHIDHGKTALIKALTGRNTDRLVEEKKRGITTDLGFTFFNLPSGIKAGIIDVPGHEKFIKNMLAGASGIDIVLLVIAADEGIMPQTREHIDILSYLGIKNGIVVITKCDIVEKEWLKIVKDDIMSFIHDTFLKNAPIVEVSSKTGFGIEKLKRVIDEKARDLMDKDLNGIFRLPIDRVFTVRGFGTIVTGTLMSGELTKGESLMIYPKMIQSRIKNIQVYNEDTEKAYAGQRTALNLYQVKKEDIKRGDVIAPKDTLTPSYLVDVKISLLKTANILKNRERIKFYNGSSETIGRVVLLDRDELYGGEWTFAQVILEQKICTLKDDKFVIRKYSPMKTIGGGAILVPNAVKHKRHNKSVINELNLISNKGEFYLIEKYVKKSLIPIEYSVIKNKFNNIGLNEITKNIKDLIKLDIDNEVLLYHKDTLDKLSRTAESILSDYHKKYPLKIGIQKEELKEKLFGTIKSKYEDNLLTLMEYNGILKIKNQHVSLWGFQIVLTDEQKKERDKIIKLYDESIFNVPRISELNDYFQVVSLVEYMVSNGDLIKINDEIYLSRDNFIMAKNILTNYFRDNSEITLAKYRDLLKTSRRIAVAILEYFDNIRLTRKTGDVRILLDEM